MLASAPTSQSQQVLEALASYVPALVARRLASDPSPITVPLREIFQAAVLFTDISGFTSLTEHLALEEPQEGLEDISRLLNTHFGELIDLVNQHGGEVVKFAGDALLALWPVQSQPPARVDRRDLTLAVRRAAQCALAIQHAMHNHEPMQGSRISLRVGVSAGEVSVSHVGGVFGRWELLVAGAPLERVSSAEQHARPGQVLLASEAWELIKESCQGAMLEDPAGLYRLDWLRDPLTLYPLPAVKLAPTMSAGLRAYIPGAILSRLAVGQSSWVAELRRVSVLFVKLPDLNALTLLERAQAIMYSLQTAIYHYEGSINKLNVDNKGTTLVAAMGLPPMSHEDDAVRAVQASQAIQAELKSLGVNCSIGVTTGQCFCGAIGTSTRREYTMVGDVVNLAARLMEVAEHEILCDAPTCQAVGQRLEFDALDAMNIKGKTSPVIAFRPRGPIKAVLRPRADLIGRNDERAALIEKLQALLRGAQKNLVLIEGEAGIGKSRLTEELLRQAQVLSVNSLVGAGDAIEKSTPYHVWRPVLYQLLRLDPGDSPEQRRQKVQQQLERFTKDPDLAKRVKLLAPLLNVVLALDLPDNEITAQMSGEVRADNTRDLLVLLLQKAAQEAPLLLALEDAHWFDSASWSVARVVSQQIQPLLLVVTTRPFDGQPPVEYTQLLNDPAAAHLKLSALSHGSTLSLVCQRLGVTALPQPVVDFIYEKAEGHPFFSEELAYALRDAGVIEITNGICRVAPHIGDLHALNFPYTIQGVIISRVDRLSPQQQLTLKVASVIGRIFAYYTLRDIYPVEADKPRLPEHLQMLERLDLTALSSAEPDLTYLFKHIITQEVVYNLMLFAQRKQLHQAVAEWYELQHADDLSPYYPLLVHHWGKAENPERALHYLEKAGEQALRDYANQEALRFFSDALTLAEQADITVEPFRRAHWERLLGEAYFGLGKLVEAREHYERALSFLGRPVPVTNPQVVYKIVAQMWRQAWHLLRPTGRRQASPEKRKVYLEAAKANKRLGEIHYYSNDQMRVLNTALYTLNLAERAELSRDLAIAYADMCLAAGTVPLHRLAHRYRQQAIQVAQIVGHQPATAYILTVTSMYLGGLAAWDEAIAALEQALAIAAQLGDHRLTGESLTVLGLVKTYQGNFEDGVKLFSEVYTLAHSHDNILQQAWGLVGQAEVLVRRGENERAVAMLNTALDLLTRNTDRTEEIRAHGILACAYLQQGYYCEAQQQAEIIQKMTVGSLPSVFTTLEGYAAVAETYLTVWKNRAQIPDMDVLPKNLPLAARQACQKLHRFAAVFRMGHPAAWLWQGVYEWQASRPHKALRAWQKGLQAAGELGMDYEVGRIHLEIARHLPADAPDCQQHLAEARKVFERIGVAYGLGGVIESSH